MLDLDQVRMLELEVTNHCNAACPQCPRNWYGGQTLPTLPLRRWTFNEFRRILSQFNINQLERVYFCGTYGDPLMHPAIANMCEWLREQNPNMEISLHTNGGAGSKSTWQRLAKCTTFVAFGIDGLADTNHVYRRGVKWPRLQQNIDTFISAGGRAYWDFIVFRHNQHQVQQARAVSQDLGFAGFNVKRTNRFIDRSHQVRDSLQVYDRQGHRDYVLYPPTDPEWINSSYQQIRFVKTDLNKYAQTTPVMCNGQRIKQVYLGADGFAFPCGWLHDRMYGPEVQDHQDQIRLIQLMERAGGWQHANAFYTSMSDVLKYWFGAIQQSWNDATRLDRCGIMCGTGINPIGDQNQEVSY